MDSLMIKLGHRVAILLAKMLIWAPFSQSMCTFSFCINPCYSTWFPRSTWSSLRKCCKSEFIIYMLSIWHCINNTLMKTKSPKNPFFLFIYFFLCVCVCYISRFPNAMNGRGIFKTLSNVYDGVVCKNTFCKKVPS